MQLVTWPSRSIFVPCKDTPSLSVNAGNTVPHPSTCTLKNKISEVPLLTSFLRTAVFSPSLLLLDPSHLYAFSSQLSFWHLPFPTSVCAEQIFLFVFTAPLSSLSFCFFSQLLQLIKDIIFASQRSTNLFLASGSISYTLFSLDQLSIFPLSFMSPVLLH